MKRFQIELGAIVKDQVTGFEGVVVGRVEYFTGCRQYSIQPRAKDGEFKPPVWLDEDRLLAPVQTPVTPAAKPSRHPPGGPQDSPPPATPAPRS